MSEENVDLVRRMLDALGQGDYQTVLAALDPQVRVRPLMQGGETLNPDVASEYVGTDGFMELMGLLGAQFHGLAWVAEEVREAGPDRVAAQTRMVGRGRESGAPVEQPMTLVATLSDGRVVALAAYSDREEGLRAAGLA